MKLSELNTFADVPAEDLEVLRRIMVERSFPRGHVFVREGDTARGSHAAMYIILEGEVAVEAKHPDGGFGVHKHMGPGDMFGMIALMDDGARSATCRATTPVRALELSRFAFRELYKSRLGTAARFHFLIAQQLVKDLRGMDEMLRAALEDDDARVIEAFSFADQTVPD